MDTLVKDRNSCIRCFFNDFLTIFLKVFFATKKKSDGIGYFFGWNHFPPTGLLPQAPFLGSKMTETIFLRLARCRRRFFFCQQWHFGLKKDFFWLKKLFFWLKSVISLAQKVSLGLKTLCEGYLCSLLIFIKRPKRLLYAVHFWLCVKYWMFSHSFVTLIRYRAKIKHEQI